jgi:hypothetical protein
MGANLSLPRAKGLSIEVRRRASSVRLATTHGAPTRLRRRYASPPRSRDPVGIPDDGVRARGVRGARRGARARPSRLHPSGGCAEWPRARDRLRGVLARVRAPGREAVRQVSRRLGAGGGGEQGHQVDRRDGHGPRARDVRLERRVGCEVRSVAFFEPRAASRAPRRRRRRDASAPRDAVPRTSRSTLPPATPRIGSRSRAFPRVVSGACFVSSPARQPQPFARPHVTPAWTKSGRPLPPGARTARAAPRGSASRARHDERRQRTRHEPSLSTRRPPPRPSLTRLLASLLAFPLVSLAALVAVASLPAAPRWTAPAACASWTSTTSPRP